MSVNNFSKFDCKLIQLSNAAANVKDNKRTNLLLTSTSIFVYNKKEVSKSKFCKTRVVRCVKYSIKSKEKSLIILLV